MNTNFTRVLKSLWCINVLSLMFLKQSVLKMLNIPISSMTLEHVSSYQYTLSTLQDLLAYEVWFSRYWADIIFVCSVIDPSACYLKITRVHLVYQMFQRTKLYQGRGFHDIERTISYLVQSELTLIFRPFDLKIYKGNFLLITNPHMKYHHDAFQNLENDHLVQWL